MKNLRLVLLVPLLLGGCSDTLWYGPAEWLGADVTYDDSAATRHLSVAAVALRADPDPTVTLSSIADVVDAIHADHPTVRLVAFPETALGYYYRPDDLDYQARLAETVPGPTTDALAVLSSRDDVFLAVGLAERDGDRLYNSMVLVSPDEGIRAVHRKVNLWDWDVQMGFSAGDGATFADVDGIRVAMMICYDGSSASLADEIVDGGAELVIHGLADMVAETYVPYNRIQARALDAWVLHANHAGDEDGNVYEGAIDVVDPSGRTRVSADGSNAVVVDTIGVY